MCVIVLEVMNTNIDLEFDSELSARVMEIVVGLLRQGLRTQHADIVRHIEREKKGIERLSVYNGWAAKIDVERIDVTDPFGSPVRLVMNSFGLDPNNPANAISEDAERELGFQAINRNDPVEVAVLNDEWRRQIADFRDQTFVSRFAFPFSDPA